MMDARKPRSFPGALLAGALAMLAMTAATVSAQPDARPARVVSINLCTDQLAMLVAEPGQLHSVSRFAADPSMSLLASEAENHLLNNARAEEIFLMKPDLVLAGMFTARSTVEMLRRLDIRVEEFAPATSFADIRANIRRMAELLENSGRGEAVIAQFDATLANMANRPGKSRSLALYEVNSYTSGGGTLADEIVRAAGLTNLASDLGHTGSARLPLEVLVAAGPDMVAGNARDLGGPALAEEILVHPAFTALAEGGRSIDIDSRYWTCGTPFAARAANSLAEQAEPVMPRVSGRVR